MWPADGWTLVVRDFGTSSDVPAIPFFILYNKYSGILRLCAFNAYNYAYSNYVASIKFAQSSDRRAIFTMDSNIKSFLNDFEGNPVKSVMGTMNVQNGWLYADFSLFGFDPNISNSTVLDIDIVGTNISSVNLNSTHFTLTQLLNNTSPTSSFPNFSGAADFTQSIIKNKTDLEKSLQTQRDLISNTDDKVKIGAFIASLTGSYISTLGPILGILKTFQGGISKPNSGASQLRFSGSLGMTGTIQTTQPITTIRFALKSGNQLSEVYKPINNIPWGVFNLTSIPSFDNIIHSYFCDYDPYLGVDECQTSGTWVINSSRVNYIVNTSLGLLNPRLEFSIKQLNPNGQFATSYNTPLSYMWSTNPNSPNIYGDRPPALYSQRVINIKFIYGLPTKQNYENELIFAKEYRYTLSQEIY